MFLVSASTAPASTVFGQGLWLSSSGFVVLQFSGSAVCLPQWLQLWRTHVIIMLFWI